MRRQRDHRLRIAGAERPGALDHARRARRSRRAALTAPSIKSPFVRRAASTSAPSVASRNARNGAERGLAQRHAGRHGVAAALDQQALGHGAPHRAADIDAGDRAARAGADAARLERNGKCRPAEFLLQPRGDETDDAGMPAFRGGDHHRALLLDAERGHRLGFGLRQRFQLDRLALAIEPVELGGDLRRLDRIVFEQQPHAEIGAADAAAGIDARAEQKAEMPGFGRAGQPRHIHQADMPGALAPAQRDQTLGDEGAVEPDQRHHVGDGAERDVVEERRADRARAAPRSRSRARAARG